MKKKIIYGCEERGDYNKPYLIRYTLIDAKIFQLCLHVFIRSDSTDLHDHPWHFVTLPIWRGYIEETPKGKSKKWPFIPLYRKPGHLHRVELINEKKAVTIVFMGKRVRDWGFVVKDKWVQWQQYFQEKGC